MLTKPASELGNCPIIVYIRHRGGKFRRYKTTRGKFLSTYMGLCREFSDVKLTASGNERTIEYGQQGED